MTKLLIILLFSSVFIACNTKKVTTVKVTEIALNTKHSGEANLFHSQEEETFLSWVEYINDSTDVLQFSQLTDGNWTIPKEISRGNDWFVNWADFPSLISVRKKQMTAHWLQKSANGTYEYDVRLTQSTDFGNTWSKSIIPHRDSVNAEHGFVSLLPTPEGNTFAVWLDGRNTINQSNNAMTLRTAEIDILGNITNEIELDNRVCDCCQTGATWTDKGPVVVYRDRTEEEIRDIAIVRNVNGVWTKPKALIKDNWKIAGCPVNGPAIDSEKNLIAVAWFTMSNEEPKVFLSISEDFGETFSDAIRIDQENAIGRVDLEINNQNIYVSWMENVQDTALIKLKTLSKKGQVLSKQQVGINSPSRTSGFPRLSKSKNEMIMAWTDATDSISIVKTYKIEEDVE